MALKDLEAQLEDELSNCKRMTANTNKYALEWPHFEDQITYLIGSGPHELIGSVNAEACQMDLEFFFHLAADDVTTEIEINKLPENRYNLTFAISEDSEKIESVESV